jgi:hypothetical protein
MAARAARAVDQLRRLHRSDTGTTGGGATGGPAGTTTAPAPATPTTPGGPTAPAGALATADAPALASGPEGATEQARRIYAQVAADVRAENRPRRLGAEGESAYDADWTHRARVYLDGREQRRVLFADADAGVVRRIRDPRPGERANRADVEELRGRVIVHFNADPYAGGSFDLADVGDGK